MNPTVEFRPIEVTRRNLWVGHKDRVEQKAARLAKRLARFGAPAPTVTYGPEVEVKDLDFFWNNLSYTAFEWVTVTGVEALWSGWQAVAVLDFTVLADEAYVTKFPGALDVEVPDAFRCSDATCDYCGTERDRNTTILFRSDDGEWKRVGTTCVLDFLGVDPRNVLNLRDVDFFEGDDDEWSAPREAYEATTDWFLRVAVEVTRVVGFVPTSAWERESTKSLTDDITRERLVGKKLDERFGFADYDFNSDDVKAKVAAIVAWVEAEGSSDFMDSAKQAVRAPAAHRRTKGILAALPFVYEKALARKAEREALAEAGKDSEFLGEVGSKLAVEVTITAAVTVETMYGTSRRVSGLTDDGDKVTTFGSGRDLFSANRGDRVEWRGTVKGHTDDEKWGKATECARVKLLDPRTDWDGVKRAKKGDLVTTFRDRAPYGRPDVLVTAKVEKVGKRDDRFVYEVEGVNGYRWGHELTIPPIELDDEEAA